MKALSKHILAAAKESESESPQARSVRRQCFENFEDCQLDEIVLAAASFPSLHPELAFVDQLQQAGEKRIGALRHLDKILIFS